MLNWLGFHMLGFCRCVSFSTRFYASLDTGSGNYRWNPIVPAHGMRLKPRTVRVVLGICTFHTALSFLAWMYEYIAYSTTARDETCSGTRFTFSREYNTPSMRRCKRSRTIAVCAIYVRRDVVEQCHRHLEALRRAWTCTADCANKFQPF